MSGHDYELRRTIVDPPGELLKPGGVARLFGVGATTLWRWTCAGKIRSLRTLGGHRRYRRAEVERELARRSTERRR
jgi:excisionase family DNA binding protein